MIVWYAGAYAPAYQTDIHVEIDKYTKNKLCTKVVLFTRLYRDARPTKHEIWKINLYVPYEVDLLTSLSSKSDVHKICNDSCGVSHYLITKFWL